VARVAELADNQYLERATEVLGDLLRDHHAAAGDPVHDQRVGPQVGQLLGEQPARLTAIGEPRFAQVAGVGSGEPRRVGGRAMLAASTSSRSEATRPSFTMSMSSIASKSPSSPKLILPL
jgi:hypothetical protein